MTWGRLGQLVTYQSISCCKKKLFLWKKLDWGAAGTVQTLFEWVLWFHVSILSASILGANRVISCMLLNEEWFAGSACFQVGFQDFSAHWVLVTSDWLLKRWDTQCDVWACWQKYKQGLQTHARAEAQCNICVLLICVLNSGFQGLGVL